MSHTVYAVGFINVERLEVVSVGIFSDDAGGVCVDQIKAYPFDICSMVGVDFEDARKKIIAHLERFFPWTEKVRGY